LKNTNQFIDKALLISDNACEIIKNASTKIKSVKSKGEISNLVTKTDIKVDHLITNFLVDNFPNHNIISEELGSIDKNSEYTWYIDPIDGTNNFVHNYPSYAVSIALFFQKRPFLGVVYDIPNNEKYFAIKGQGSYCNNNTINVSNVNSINDGLFVTGFIPYDEKYIDKNLRIIKNMNLKSHGVRRLGAASIDMCHVAKGILEGFWEYNLQPWDTAAGNIIITESGGIVTNEKNKDYNFDKCIVSSNSFLHKDFLEIINGS
tara:strand:+ start:986 stop:1768 length:783 start_codon:yes stop_codon:yes gene_type:complete